MKHVIAHVDCRVLTGVRPEGRHSIAAGLQRELEHVFADREAVSDLRAGGDTVRLQGGKLPVGRGSKPQRVEERVTPGIGQEIGK